MKQDRSMMMTEKYSESGQEVSGKPNKNLKVKRKKNMNGHTAK